MIFIYLFTIKINLFSLCIQISKKLFTLCSPPLVVRTRGEWIFLGFGLHF